MRQRLLPTLRFGALLALLLALTAGCGPASETAAPGAGEASSDASVDPAPTSAHDDHAGHAHAEHDPDVQRAAAGDGSDRNRAARSPGERPLPNFTGRTLDGDRLSISSLIGQRMLVYFFNPEDKSIEVVSQAVAAVSKQAQRNNFQVVGVGIGSNTTTLRAFSQKLGFEFPVIDDSSGNISSGLRLQGTMLILGVDPEGYVTFGHAGFNTSKPDSATLIAGVLRESLRIDDGERARGGLFDRPMAPEFETTDIDGKPFSTSELAGRPRIVIFFLHTCPHCHHALEFLKTALPKIPEAKRPALVAISLQNRPSAIRMALAEEGLDFFRVLVDPGGDIAESYGMQGGVPDISVVDSAGAIVYRVRGWRDDRDPPLMRMYIAKVAGERVPMLLAKKGFTGNDACTVCHELEAATWAITSHATAFSTLVTHGDDRDPECVSCHVVGFDQPGGYGFERPAEYLENVGCENCHGRGGPHVSPEFTAEGYANVCATCHDKKHSLGFDFDTFRPLISHTAIASLSDEERAKRYGAGGHARALLPSKIDFVGSNACQSCHESEFSTWAKSQHGRAVDSLTARNKAGDPDCLRCHTTGFGKTGGFPEGGDVGAHADLARVGCESCHGPGGDHIAPDAKRIGTIVSLGDKCDSCVILQICGSCHDEANDPDFEFQVEEHIERQRHGTIEPGTGKPLGTTAFGTLPRPEAQIAELMRRTPGEG